MRRSVVRIGLALAVLTGAVSVAPGYARAETFVPCGISGRVTPAQGDGLVDAEGRAVAQFSGGALTLTVSGFTLGSGSRARVETGSGRGSFRVAGFIDTKGLPIVTGDIVPIAAGHVWIGKEREVRVVGTTPTQIKVERVASPPLQQRVSGYTTCRNLKLSPGTPPGYTPPGFARGYVLRRDRLELFAGPGGAAVGAVEKSPSANGVLFFSNENQGGWLHVEYRADIVVDAWARAGDLSALPAGETMDQLANPTLQRSAPRMALGGNPRVARAVRNVPVRNAAKDGATVVGVIEPDAEVYVVDVMVGWVNVLPKGLEVMPPPNGQFWVKRAELAI